VVEQNKVRKSWWKVINNFVNVFMSANWVCCLCNTAFSTYYVIRWGLEIYFTWLGRIPPFQTIVSDSPDDCQLYYKILLLISHKLSKFSNFEPFCPCDLTEFSEVHMDCSLQVVRICVCVHVCMCVRVRNQHGVISFYFAQ
jgi:hypothetical protein